MARALSSTATGGTSKPFTVLALESSADDTCAAIVRSDRRILSNVVLKQGHIHKKYSGIQPRLAILSHTEQMPFAVRSALDQAGLGMGEVDGVAFTQGPGMGGCLAVGCNAAKTLAAALGKPLVGVNHMRAHALTVMLTEPRPPAFPYLALLVSGGHTMLVLVRSEESYELISQTVDEAIGRTFDHVADMLGLEWGTRGLGAALEQCASTHSDSSKDAVQVSLPRSMRGSLEMSFCGLRSAVQRLIEDIKQREGGKLPPEAQAAIAAKFQEVAVDQLAEKLQRALKECRRRGVLPTAIVASGGVASNLYLREQLCKAAEDGAVHQPLPVYYPPLELCTDNAVMIAWASMGRFMKGDTDSYDLRPLPEWKIDMERPVKALDE